MTRTVWNLLVVGALALALVGCEGDGGGDGNGGGGTDVVTSDSGGASAGEDTTATPAEDVVATPDEDVPIVPDEDTFVRPAAPTATLTLPAYSAVHGVHTFDVTWTGEVTTVTLLVDGANAGTLDPSTLEADLRSVEPGIHDVAVYVADAAGQTAQTDPIPAIFAGRGEFLAITDSWSDSTEMPGWRTFDKTVPEGATSIYDEKGHVRMPSDMHEARAWLYWTCDTVWNFGFDIGTGGCPDDGQLLAAADLESAEGPLEVSYAKDDGAALNMGTWFAHVRFTDGMAHQGETACLNVLFLALP